jgi:tripartite-type tricarboxylate transporter receptor subunit TctC
MNYRPNSQLARRGLLAIAPLAAVLLASGCGTNASGAQSGQSQAFPAANTKVEWIVPSAAGAGNDILARIVAPALEKQLGAPVRVVNKEGGNQVIGLNYLANSKPDGQTMGYTNIPSIFGRYLDPSKKASFNRESFAPVGSFAFNDVVIGVNKSSPYSTIGDLFDAVKAKPGAITVGTDSRAGDDHVNLRVLEKALGLDFNIVHYNSGADKIAALVSGEVDFALGGLSSFVGPYKSGEVKLLTIINDKQSTFLPDVPTLESAGYEVEPMTNNFAVSVPAGTPPATVAALEKALKDAIGTPEVGEKLKNAGTAAAWLSAAEVAQKWQEREAKAKPIIDELLKENA